MRETPAPQDRSKKPILSSQAQHHFFSDYLLAMSWYLDQWEAKTMAWHTSNYHLLESYFQQREEQSRAFEQWRWTTQPIGNPNEAEIEAKQKEMGLDAASTSYHLKQIHVITMELFNYHSNEWQERLTTWVYNQKEEMRKDMIARITQIAGEIERPSELSIQENGEVCGVIKGKKAAVLIETIPEKTWSIQRFPFSFVVRKITG